MINSYSNTAANDGFIALQFDPEKTDNPTAQTVILPESKNPFVSKGVIPIYDGQLDKLYNVSGYEMLPSNIQINKRIHQ